MNRNDKLLVAALLALAIVFSFSYRWLAKEEGGFVVVTVDGEEYGTFSLEEDASFWIEGAGGGRNYLLVENGAARMEEASCPDLLCVQQGEIHRNGESIVCLPNKVVVQVVGGKGQGIDALQ